MGAASAVRNADFVFLCVGTPPGDDGSADLSAIEAVARNRNDDPPIVPVQTLALAHQDDRMRGGEFNFDLKGKWGWIWSG